MNTLTKIQRTAPLIPELESMRKYLHEITCEYVAFKVPPGTIQYDDELILRHFKERRTDLTQPDGTNCVEIVTLYFNEPIKLEGGVHSIGFYEFKGGGKFTTEFTGVKSASKKLL